MSSGGPRSAIRPRLASPWLPTALLAALALFVCAGSAAASTHPLTTGVSYVYEDEPAAFAQVRKAGAQLTLTPLEWGSVAPQQPPQGWQPDNPADPNYDWSHYDLWVRHAVEAGLTPVLQVRGAPTWAQRCGGGASTPDSPCDPDPQALAAFATAAARRYSGSFQGLPHVSYWQGLNEPNLSIFFSPQYINGKAASASLYRTLLDSFYGAIKAVDRSNLVLAAGLGPIAVPHYTIGPMQFARELLCMRGRDRFTPLPGDCHGGVNFDIFDIHPYTTGGPTHEGGANDVELGDIPKLKRLLAAADRAGRINSVYRHTPLWVSELSWDSNPPDPGGLAIKVLTRWTSEALYRTWKAGVSDFFWFSLRDFKPEPNVPFSETLQSGLYFRGASVAEDQPKGNLFAFRFPFVAYPSRRGLSYWGRTPNSAGGRVAIQLLRHRHWQRVATVRADQFGIFRGRVARRYGRNHKGAARAVYQGQAAPPFSMRPIPDFTHPPFG